MNDTPARPPPLFIRIDDAPALPRSSVPASVPPSVSLPAPLDAPACASCRERPAAFLLETDGVDLESARPLAPATARLVCEACHDAQAPGGRLPRGARAARLAAGALAALAAARPRCDVITCSGFAPRWGDSCADCAARAAAAVAQGLDAIEAKARAVASASMRPVRWRR